MKQKKDHIISVYLHEKFIVADDNDDDFIPLAILIWACFGKYFHCTAILVNKFQIYDTISPIDFYIGQTLKIDRASFVCRNGIASIESLTIRLDALVSIGQCFDRYQPPKRNSKETYLEYFHFTRIHVQHSYQHKTSKFFQHKFPVLQRNYIWFAKCFA